MPRQKRRNRPRLSKLDAKRLSKRPETPNILRQVFESKIELDQIEVSSTYSEISDVFEEFHKHSFYNVKKSGKKNLSKYEADILTMDQFTDDFKNTMEVLKDVLQIEEDMINENIDTINDVIKTPKTKKDLPASLKEDIEKLLTEPEQVVHIEQVSTPRKSSEDLSYDYMSGIWSMIDAHCKNTKFTISPMNFDIYNQSRPHWLERPEISQQTIDDSKLKCQKWLSQYHE